jgi:hypothetical protein
MSGNNNNTQNKGGMSKNDASRIQAAQVSHSAHEVIVLCSTDCVM